MPHPDLVTRVDCQVLVIFHSTSLLIPVCCYHCRLSGLLKARAWAIFIAKVSKLATESIDFPAVVNGSCQVPTCFNRMSLWF